LKKEYNPPTSVRHPNLKKKDENVCRALVTRVCTACHREKPVDQFYKRSNGKSHASCKNCQKHHKKEYYAKNRDILRAKRKIYYDNNKEVVRKSESRYRKKRKKFDKAFHLLLSCRNHIYHYLKNNKKYSTIQYLGCSSEELKNYLESKFLPGMTWDNYGLHGWHIDHIKPLSKFDLLNEVECKEAFNHTNLQPLWAKDNIAKGNGL
jgi:hypothetical protein